MPLDHVSENVSEQRIRHDVMNHLGIILGYSELFSDDADDPEVKEAMLEIHNAAVRIRELVVERLDGR